MATLRKIVEKKKAEKYAWPAGWMTREDAANDLGVAPRDVDDALREAIRDGDVLKQFFPVWDSRQGRTVKLPGYRVAVKDADPSSTVATGQGNTGSIDERIRAAILRNLQKSDYEIAKNFRGGRVADVARIRASIVS